MGWLEKLVFVLLCLPLSSRLCFASIAESPIATAASNKENQHGTQVAPKVTLPAAQPVSKGARSHLNTASLPRSHALSFNSQQLDQQLQRYLRFVAQSGPPDILIVGSSRALQGIDPIVLQQTLSRRGYSKRSIFNIGINGATAQLVDLLLLQILTPDQLPRLILWGDGVRAFNSGRIDITYNRAIASEGYQLLSAGIRPTLLTEFLPAAPLCAAFSPQQSAPKLTYRSKSFNLMLTLDQRVKQPQPCWEALKRLVLPESITKPAPQTHAKLQEATGFQVASDQFQPSQYFQRYPRVHGKYDADYRNFTLDGKQTEAFTSVVTFAKRHQIPVVFVNLPLTQIYLDDSREVNEKEFRVYLQRLARSQALSVYDLSQRWLNQNDYFTDPSHLNRYGAAAVATELGKTLLLPKAQLSDLK